MQFTRTLYRTIMRSTISILILVFLFLNILLSIMGKSHQESQVQAQYLYLNQMRNLTIHALETKALSKTVMAWRLVDRHGQVMAGNTYGNSWNMAESQFPHEIGSIVISHESLLAAQLWTFLIANVCLALIALVGVGWAHHRVYIHWKVLIQLEAWASRFSRNDKFKFYIKTRDYHLVNTIRTLNNMRIEAQRGGQQVDHFIRSHTFLDKTTGLGNRLYFEHRLESLLQQEDQAYGAVLIIQYGALEQMREMNGKESVISLLQQYAEILKEYLDDTRQSVVSRISANDFAILLPFVDGKEVERVAMNIIRRTQGVPLPSFVDIHSVCHIGADVFGAEDSSFQIMAEADMALRAAQLHGPSGWFMYDSGQLPQTDVKGSVRWRSMIENAIAKQSFALLYQPVVGHDMVIHHHEVLVRMADDKGELLSAKVFLPMARKCGLIPEVDRRVLLMMADTLAGHDVHPISVNIHIDSWLNRDFCNWLIKYLKRNQDIADNIIFEVSEFELAQHAKKLSNILAAVKRYNSRIMVDQVGLYVVDTEYLNHLKIDFLKLHQSIVNHINTRPENQMFIRSLQGVMNNKTSALFAMGVESEPEISALKRLGVIGMQGHYIKLAETKLLAAKVLDRFDGDI